MFMVSVWQKYVSDCILPNSTPSDFLLVLSVAIVGTFTPQELAYAVNQGVIFFALLID